MENEQQSPIKSEKIDVPMEVSVEVKSVPEMKTEEHTNQLDIAPKDEIFLKISEIIKNCKNLDELTYKMIKNDLIQNFGKISISHFSNEIKGEFLAQITKLAQESQKDKFESKKKTSKSKILKRKSTKTKVNEEDDEVEENDDDDDGSGEGEEEEEVDEEPDIEEEKIPQESKKVQTQTADYKSQFGQIVWAKGTGFPWWPSYVFNPDHLCGKIRKKAFSNIGKNHTVYYYDSEFGFVKPSCIKPFQEFKKEYSHQPALASKEKASLQRAIELAEKELLLSSEDRVLWTRVDPTSKSDSSGSKKSAKENGKPGKKDSPEEVSDQNHEVEGNNTGEEKEGNKKTLSKQKSPLSPSSSSTPSSKMKSKKDSEGKIDDNDEGEEEESNEEWEDEEGEGAKGSTDGGNKKRKKSQPKEEKKKNSSNPPKKKKNVTEMAEKDKGDELEQKKEKSRKLSSSSSKHEKNDTWDSDDETQKKKQKNKVEKENASLQEEGSTNAQTKTSLSSSSSKSKKFSEKEIKNDVEIENEGKTNGQLERSNGKSEKGVGGGGVVREETREQRIARLANVLTRPSTESPRFLKTLQKLRELNLTLYEVTGNWIIFSREVPSNEELSSDNQEKDKFLNLAMVVANLRKHPDPLIAQYAKELRKYWVDQFKTTTSPPTAISPSSSIDPPPPSPSSTSQLSSIDSSSPPPPIISSLPSCSEPSGESLNPPSPEPSLSPLSQTNQTIHTNVENDEFN